MKTKNEIRHDLDSTWQLLQGRCSRANRILAELEVNNFDAINEISTEILLMEQMAEQLIEFCKSEN